MRTLLIDNGSSLTKKLALLSPGQETICTYNDLPDDASDYDLIILSGTSKFPLLDNLPLLTDEINLIRTFQKPIIGVCFGHELLGYVHGASITPLPQRHVGLTEITVTHNHQIFSDQKTLIVYENHTYGVTGLPSTCTELARSAHAIAAFKHNELPHFGFQFHPEHHTDKQFGDEVFTNLFQLLT